MNRGTFVQDVLSGADKSPVAVLLRGALTPLSWLHHLGLEVYLAPFRTGIRRRYELPVPVIVIGNLTSGGAGKTPMTALIAERIRDSGKRVAVISRGHGGSGESGKTPRVVSDGAEILLSPAEAGDEPVLLAKLLPGVPVVVGRDRRRSGSLAVERFAPEVILCDDALQYWQLARNLNIILLDARRPFDNGHVLPRGLLREPPSHLSRAGIIALTRADRATPEELERSLSLIARYAPQTPTFTARHAPTNWIRLGGNPAENVDNNIAPLEALRGASAFAFSGIADGEAFLQVLRDQGVSVVGERTFGDHFAYTAEDVQSLARQTESASVVITTEKDAVKAAPLWPVGGKPLYALRIRMKMDDEAGFFQAIDNIMSIADGRYAF